MNVTREEIKEVISKYCHEDINIPYSEDLSLKAHGLLDMEIVEIEIEIQAYLIDKGIHVDSIELMEDMSLDYIMKVIEQKIK